MEMLPFGVFSAELLLNKPVSVMLKFVRAPLSRKDSLKPISPATTSNPYNYLFGFVEVAGLMGYSDTKIVYISDYNPVLDNITYNCRGFVNDGYSGNPISDSSGWAFFECKRFPDGRCLQILTGWFHPNIRYIRNYQNGTWTTWMSI